jgi:hypothetical protein
MAVILDRKSEAVEPNKKERAAAHS